MLRRVNVDINTYSSIIDNYKEFIIYRDLNNYLAKGYCSKTIVVVDKETSTLICQGALLNNLLKEKRFNDWMQIVCVLDNSLDKIDDDYTPYASQANAEIKRILNKKYTDDEINKIYDEHSLDKGKTMIHKLLPEQYTDGNVYKFSDCVYYDINRAHTDALIEMFPKCKKALINTPKKYVNIYVGDLCNNNRRGVFNWIVNRTREYIDAIIEKANGEILYANTDGAIIHHPSNYLETSNEIGRFKSEIIDDVIYAYYCKGSETSTAYTIYQYTNPKNGVTLKGNAKYLVRQGMDLSKGIVNKGKIYKDENEVLRVKYLRQEEVDIYEEV